MGSLIAIGLPVGVGIAIEEILFVIVVARSRHFHRVDVIFDIGQIDIVTSAFVVDEAD